MTTASWLVRLASHAMPRGPVRDRYRTEFLADLTGLDRSQQLRYAVGVVTHVGALRLAVAGHLLDEGTTGAMAEPASPLCRLNLHHTWHWEANEDGDRFRRCVRCGKDDPRPRGPLDANGFGVGVTDIMGG